MLENQPSTSFPVHPLLMIILVLLTSAVGFLVVGPLIGYFVSLAFYPGSMLELAERMQLPALYPDVKIPLYIMQGFATLVGLIVVPIILIKYFRKSSAVYFQVRPVDTIPLLMTPLLVIMFMGINSLFIEWNANMHLPEFLKGLEEWARKKEDLAEEVTKLMTHFDSFGELILAVVVIAVIPAVGEELVFRGLIQNEMMRATKRSHLSIWIAAALFSAIHVQFFGFIPRLLLGALFGYLYYWSGSLSISMVAHFVNNGFQVVGLYLYQQGTSDFNMDEETSLPWTMIIFSTLITAALLVYFKKYYQRQHTSIEL